MRELDLYRKHLTSINGFDAKGCHKIAEEFCQDDLNALYVVTISFHKRQQDEQRKSFQVLKLHSEFQSDALLQALQDMDSDSVNDIFQAVSTRLSLNV